MLASALQECESALSIHTPLSLEPPTPSPTPSHPNLWVVTAHEVEFPVLYRKLHINYFTYGDIYVSMLLFQFIPPSPSLTVYQTMNILKNLCFFWFSKLKIY